uniref:Uncharacterized protein n=1 Tax=Rhizophora mucronata TaxID=61149 RepID=A0A2P2QVB8_RHIMU
MISEVFQLPFSWPHCFLYKALVSPLTQLVFLDSLLNFI